MSEPLTDADRACWLDNAQYRIRLALANKWPTYFGSNIERIDRERLRYEATIQAKNDTIAALVKAMRTYQGEVIEPDNLPCNDAWMALEAAIKEASNG